MSLTMNQVEEKNTVTTEENNLLLFKVLWCISICWFVLTGNAWLNELSHLTLNKLPTALLFTFSIIFLFSKNNKIFYLVLLLVFIEWASLLPKSPNHRWIFFIASILVFKDLGTKKLSDSLIYLASIIYFFAFLAKVNSDFLFSNHSCSVVFFEHIKNFIWLPKITYTPILSFSIALSELLISILLLSSKTRKIAIFIGLSLHLGLALDIIKHFLDFSSVMSIFLISEIVLNNSKGIKKKSIYLISNFFAIFFTYLFFHTLVIKPHYPEYILKLTIFWLFYYSIIIYIFFDLKNNLSIGNYNKKSIFTYIVFTITILNGLSPYLGIKTRTSFSMYSNLWITNNESNHLIFSKSLDVFGFLKDEAEILSSENQNLRDVNNQNLKLPFFELLKEIKSKPFLNVKFKYKESTYEHPKDERPKDYNKIDFLIPRKLLIFQPSNKEVAKECIW